jgi:hypothetical protein
VYHRSLWWTITLDISMGSRQGCRWLLGERKVLKFILVFLNSCSAAHCKSVNQLPLPQWDEEDPSSILFARLGTIWLFLFGSVKKSNGIWCGEFIRASGPHSSHFEGHPEWSINWGFSRADEVNATLYWHESKVCIFCPSMLHSDMLAIV